MKNICIFGGSVTWGGNDSEKGGWVNRLRLWVDSQIKHEIEVYNLGVTGDTTENLLVRFEVEALARKPALIIFSVGINDSAYDNETDMNRVPLPKFIDNMEQLVRKAYMICNNVVIIGLSRVEESKTNPIPWKKNLYFKIPDILVYDNELRKIALKNDTPFLDVASLLSREDLDDGLHPNSEGHEKLFIVVKDFLISKQLLIFNN